MTGRPNGFAIVTLSAFLGGCAAVSHPIYGVREGQLASCDGYPGCVSTQTAPDSPHHVPPIAFSSLRSDARTDLVTALRAIGDNRIVSSHRSYLRAEFRVDEVLDDVEFYLPVDQRVIHIRSVTREGSPDSSKHRDRIEFLRTSVRELQERR